jgi:hypothetical protein
LSDKIIPPHTCDGLQDFPDLAIKYLIFKDTTEGAWYLYTNSESYYIKYCPWCGLNLEKGTMSKLKKFKEWFESTEPPENPRNFQGFLLAIEAKIDELLKEEASER